MGIRPNWNSGAEKEFRSNFYTVSIRPITRPRLDGRNADTVTEMFHLMKYVKVLFAHRRSLESNDSHVFSL
jgi:hypothetical protein